MLFMKFLWILILYFESSQDAVSIIYELKNNEITGLILEAMGAEISSIEYVADRKGHDLRYSVDWTKINRELGYEPQINFEDGLRETIQWYRDNQAWWKPLKSRL